MSEKPQVPLTKPGDIGAFGVGFAIGFLIDLALLPGGVPPGTFGSVIGTGAVGLKNSVEAALNQRTAQREKHREQVAQQEAQIKQVAEAERATRNRIDTVISRVVAFNTVCQQSIDELPIEKDKERVLEIVRVLSREVKFFESGIVPIDDLEGALEAAIDQYRTLLRM